MTPRVLVSFLVGLALILAALLVSACAAPPLPARPVADGDARLTVVTYNVNYGLAGDAETLAAVRRVAAGADVVVLVETTPAWERELRADAALGAAFPHMVFHHCCGAGGLAVLSRFALSGARVLPPVDAGWFPAWRMVVDSPLGAVQLLAVHLRPPLSEKGSIVSGYWSTPRVRRAEIEAHVGALDPALPTLVLGDFNEDENGRALRFLARRGLRSALPAFAPRAHTWRWSTGFGEVTERLDHIVHDRRLVPVDARVVDAGRSDHLPVVAVFARAAD